MWPALAVSNRRCGERSARTNPRGPLGDALLVVVLSLVLPGLACQGVSAPWSRDEARGPASAQVVRLPTIEPPTLDPGLATETNSADVIDQLFEGIVGVDDQGRISGVQAEHWDVADDGLTYVFRLRAGLRWSDGQPVTAQDYEYAWKRNITPATGSKEASALYPIRHARQIHAGAADPNTLGVRAIDRRTLQVRLEQPAAYFLPLVSTTTFYPLPRWAIEQYGPQWTEAEHIVTNGPFKLEAWRHQQEIVLARADDYWGPKPTLAGAVYRVFPEGGGDEMVTAFQAGELDLGNASFLLPPAYADQVHSEPGAQDELQSFPASATTFVVVNHRRPALGDARVRSALGMALDRQELLRNVLKSPDTPATSLQPEGIIGRQPKLWPAEDVQRAQGLLADAGYPNGRGFPAITFTYNRSERLQALGKYLQRRWMETLGIDVRLADLPIGEFLEWRYTQGWTEQGDLSVGIWDSDYEDPHDWYNLLWDSVTDPLQFNGGWQNHYYNLLVRRARAEGEAGSRRRLYELAEGVLAHDYVHIPLYYQRYAVPVKPYVQGYVPARILGTTPLRRITVAAR
jgi:oligopeptide transport system substrate-binding protein